MTEDQRQRIEAWKANAIQWRKEFRARAREAALGDRYSAMRDALREAREFDDAEIFLLNLLYEPTERQPEAALQEPAAQRIVGGSTPMWTQAERDQHRASADYQRRFDAALKTEPAPPPEPLRWTQALEDTARLRLIFWQGECAQRGQLAGRRTDQYQRAERQRLQAVVHLGAVLEAKWAGQPLGNPDQPFVVLEERKKLLTALLTQAQGKLAELRATVHVYIEGCAGQYVAILERDAQADFVARLEKEIANCTAIDVVPATPPWTWDDQPNGGSLGVRGDGQGLVDVLKVGPGGGIGSVGNMGGGAVGLTGGRRGGGKGCDGGGGVSVGGLGTTYNACGDRVPVAGSSGDTAYCTKPYGHPGAHSGDGFTWHRPEAGVQVPAGGCNETSGG